MSGHPQLRVIPGGASCADRVEQAAHQGAAEPGPLAAEPGPLAAEPGPLAAEPASLAAHPASVAAGPALRAAAGGRSRGLVSGALAAAGSWLLEPAAPAPAAAAPESPPAPSGLRPVVAVFGLARGCGVTVVSRALAAELARRDVEGVAAVLCDARAAGIPLATQAASRLARALADVPGADTRAVGRLCLVAGAHGAALTDSARHLAPLVLDAGSTSLGGVPAALADRVVVVATASTEPALASVAAECLGRVGHEPIVVLNRASAAHDPEISESGWSGRAAHRLPESRMGAQLALGGREARGELGRAMAELADLCEARR